MDIRFEWDKKKAQANLKKHDISFEFAVQVFSDPFLITRQDRFENGEYRWQTIGMVDNRRLLLVAHVTRMENNTEIIRLISARKATKTERKHYDNG